MNNNNNYIKVTEYADTAYNGKANPYYRENIAPPEQRKRHLAKGQCQMEVFPREKITGICWNNRQSIYNNPNTQEIQQHVEQKLNIKEGELRLALNSLSQNAKEAIFLVWMYLHLGCTVLLLMYLFIVLVLGGWSTFLDNLDVLVIGLGAIFLSKFLFLLLDKLNLTPTGQYVVFNRQTGMVEIANDKRSGFLHIPFEEFNAHHRTIHSERGAPHYGFTLLHYKEDLMYQIADYLRVEDALVQWELIKNFMDTTTPLADIPQFEPYRLYDPTTAAYDRKHGRPANFWRRVDKKFMKNVANIANDAVYNFPSQKADTLHEAFQYGYKVPDIIHFPWKEVDIISDDILVIKRGWFSRYIISPLLP